MAETYRVVMLAKKGGPEVFKIVELSSSWRRAPWKARSFS
jgi:hypothetical protein